MIQAILLLLLFATGALLDVERHQAKTACTYKFDKHNNSTESIFKLDHYEKEINVSDSYQVNKERE